MNKESKLRWIAGLFSGLIYAGCMAGFHYADNQDFSLGEFVFNFLFFGIVMSLISRFNSKKQKENKAD